MEKGSTSHALNLQRPCFNNWTILITLKQTEPVAKSLQLVGGGSLTLSGAEGGGIAPLRAV